MGRSDDRTMQSVPGCVQFADLFQDSLLEEPPTSSAPAALRRRYTNLTEQAGEICAGCPMMNSCLYEAVVRHDVSGFVAGTTQRQRAQIRRRLGIIIHAEDFDSLAGSGGRNRPVDHDEVLRLRRTNPDETLESIAQRLGCSLSTVKRHLRRERAAQKAGSGGPRMRRSLPTESQVVAVAAEVAAAGRHLPGLRRAA